MTTGIYALYWEEQDLIYIGLSQNIEYRFKSHLNRLKNYKHSNYKVQNAFNNYGEPKLSIIEECSIEELNDREIFWTREFNALGKQGLCIVEAGENSGGFGPNSAGAKYSKITILKIFSLLYRTELSSTEITKKLKLPNVYLVSKILNGTNHLWLKSIYPTKYSLMLINNKNRARKNGCTPDNLKFSKDSIIEAFLELVYTDKSAKNISSQLNIDVHIIQSISNCTQYLWLQELCPEEYIILKSKIGTRTNSASKLGIIYPKILSPEGKLYTVENLQEFARIHKINNSSLCQLLHRKRKSANKWKLA